MRKWLWATLIALVCGTALGASVPKTAMRDVKNASLPSPAVIKLMGEGGLEVPAKTSRYGRFKVINKTYTITIDVWLTLDDQTTDWYYLGTVRPRHWKSWKLRRSFTNGDDYLVAGLDQNSSTYNANYPEWGPRAFWLNSKMTWTLWF